MKPQDNVSNMNNPNRGTAHGTQGTNDQYRAALNNHANQGNPNHPEYQKVHPKGK